MEQDKLTITLKHNHTHAGKNLLGTVKVFISMKTGSSLFRNQVLSCERYSYLILLYLIWRGGAMF